MLNREQLAEVLNIPSTRVAQWTKDGTIPAEWISAEGKSFLYAPVCVALGLLILELEGFLGKSSPATKPAARRVAPILRSYWDELSSGGAVNTRAHALVRVSDDSEVELKVPLTFLATAREKLTKASA
jgi:hypothetical protein